MIASMLLTQFVFAQTAPVSGGNPLAAVYQFAPFLLMFVVIYFLLIRPANKQRKEHQTLLSALKKDDEVMTAGGILGRVISIDDQVATLEISDKVKIKILRDRIAGRWNPSAPPAQK